MSQQDLAIRAMDKDRTVRVVLAQTTDLVDEARRRHDTSPTATAALGRVLTAGVMMGLELKGKESVTIRVNGGGPLGTILAVADSEGSVRGYVSDPTVEPPVKAQGKSDVGAAVGANGLLEVTRDMGLKAPFVGTVPLVSGEIGEDMAHYFTYSEQIPSLVSLGVLVDRDYTVAAAGGLFVQALPGADMELLKILEDQVLEMGTISNRIKDSSDLESIINEVFGQIEYDILESREVCFSCHCSQEKVVSILRMLAPEDIEKALESQGLVEVNCNFCNETYRFNKEEVEILRK
ncbi:MAG: Hsp33 family molecular chaperone HslO [Acidobacteriota bacterium]